MTENNRRKLWKIIQEAGDYLRTRGTHYLTLHHTSYADNKILIKNKSHKDSSIFIKKLVPKLDHFKINQIVNSRSFC